MKTNPPGELDKEVSPAGVARAMGPIFDEFDDEEAEEEEEEDGPNETDDWVS